MGRTARAPTDSARTPGLCNQCPSTAKLNATICPHEALPLRAVCMYFKLNNEMDVRCVNASGLPFSAGCTRDERRPSAVRSARAPRGRRGWPDHARHGARDVERRRTSSQVRLAQRRTRRTSCRENDRARRASPLKSKEPPAIRFLHPRNGSGAPTSRRRASSTVRIRVMAASETRREDSAGVVEEEPSEGQGPRGAARGPSRRAHEAAPPDPTRTARRRALRSRPGACPRGVVRLGNGGAVLIVVPRGVIPTIAIAFLTVGLVLGFAVGSALENVR